MKLMDFANRAQFEERQGFLIKESNGYNLILRELQMGYVSYIVVLVCLDKTVTKEELKEINQKVGTKRISFADKTNSVLMFQFDDLFGIVKEEKINKAINSLFTFTSTLLEMNFNNQSKCIFCGQDKEDEEVVFGNYNGLYLPQHLSCRQNAKNKAVSQMNKENANTQMYPISILLGFVGALLASLLINILVYFVFDGTMYSLMYAAVPLASFFAYKLGKAPKNKKMVLSVVITSVVATLLVDFIFYGLMAVGLDMTFGAFISEFATDILYTEFMTLLFLALGTWVSWNIISKTNDKDVNKF